MKAALAIVGLVLLSASLALNVALALSAPIVVRVQRAELVMPVARPCRGVEV